MDMVIQARLISPQRLSALSTWHWHIELHTFINQFYHAEIDELQNASNVCFVASLVDQKPTVNYQIFWAINHIIVSFSEDIQPIARQTWQVVHRRIRNMHVFFGMLKNWRKDTLLSVFKHSQTNIQVPDSPATWTMFASQMDESLLKAGFTST